MVALLIGSVGLLSGLLLMWRTPRVPACGSGSPKRRISVIVPARNEESNLPRLLVSLAAQDVGAVEVVVVDDESTDRTAAIAHAAGAVVVTTGGPPDGWTGKTWACHTGMRSSSGDLLVFLDADTWLAPDGLRRLDAEHERAVPDGLLSVQPYHVTEQPYEQLSAVCNVVPVMASALAAVVPPRSNRVAFGPCVVTTRSALADAGGFESVRTEVVEDAALAGRYRTTGRPVLCVLGGETVQFRMYPAGTRSLIEGWVKSLAGGAVRTAPLPTIGAVLWVTGALATTASLVGPTPQVFALWLLYAIQLWWMLRRLGSFRWWVPIVFPVPALAFVGCFVVSAAHRVLRRPVRWRGRHVAVGGH